MTKNKKSTSAEAPIREQDYGTTPAEKSQAEKLFDLIGEGPGHALHRPKDPMVDRQLRRLIADANMSGDCIINVGTGYFRPGDDDCVELDAYLKAEASKGRQILRRVSRMRQVYERRYQ